MQLCRELLVHSCTEFKKSIAAAKCVFSLDDDGDGTDFILDTSLFFGRKPKNKYVNQDKKTS